MDPSRPGGSRSREIGADRRKGDGGNLTLVNPAIYRFMESASPYLVLWSFLFTLITTMRIVRHLRHSSEALPDSAYYTELAGAPLTLLQPACFVWAVLTRDWL